MQEVIRKRSEAEERFQSRNESSETSDNFAVGVARRNGSLSSKSLPETHKGEVYQNVTTGFLSTLTSRTERFYLKTEGLYEEHSHLSTGD